MILNSRKSLNYGPPPIKGRGVTRGTPAPLPDETWRDWLGRVFPKYTKYGFAPHHVTMWDWGWAIERGVSCQSFIQILARGGAKSTSAELLTCGVGAKGTRRYALYISETQDQADKHVQSIAAMLEHAGFDRAINKYGSSRGWRRNQLRLANGYKVEAIGLDTAARGIKVDEDRPDLIIFDDIDSKFDTPQATKKKIELLTMNLLPAMAPGGVVLGVQNIIHAHSIFNQLSHRGEGSARFLYDRIISGPHPAIYNLKTEEQDGRDVIIEGTPSWEGQSLAICQKFIDDWGLPAFESECQHKVAIGGKYFVTFDELYHVGRAPYPYPEDTIFWGYFDYGWTHNNVFGVLALIGERYYLLGEHVANQMGILAHSNHMHALLQRLRIPRHWLAYIAAGHDVFSPDKNGRTIAMDYQDLGWGMSRAAIDRINGWAAIRQVLGDPKRNQPPRLIIAPECIRTIEALHNMVRDPKRPEDVLKVNCSEGGIGGDDPADGLRYGIHTAPSRAEVEQDSTIYDDDSRVEISPL